MRQNGIYPFSYVEKFTNVRTRMAIAAERNDHTPLFGTSRRVKLAVTQKKFTARSAETSSLPFVNPDPFAIFNPPGDLLSYHIDQPRTPRERK